MREKSKKVKSKRERKKKAKVNSYSKNIYSIKHQQTIQYHVNEINHVYSRPLPC